TALVDGIISPLIAAIFGKPNFDNVGVFTLNGATISFGMVLTALVNFLLTAAAVYYLIVVPINKVKGPKPEPAKPEDVVLLGEIRDLLKAK
ncbi:MAG: MscL family protein, partial [Propionibacteriaceae bacterium]|nr:MscL family protein [Propionibacteriaceae bacterium]